MNSIINFISQPELVAVIVSVFISVLIYQLIIPWIISAKIDAQEKLKNFYNFAFTFVKIREDFSSIIDGETHNKNNCGLFHNFNIDMDVPVQVKLFYEQYLFDLYSNSSSYVSYELSELIIEYLTLRAPEMSTNRIDCRDSKLIRLRKEIEDKILKEYLDYKKISQMNPFFSKMIYIPFQTVIKNMSANNNSR